MTEDTFEQCERVQRGGSGHGTARHAFYEALAMTATTGKALRVPLNGEPRELLENRWRSAMAKRGLLMRASKDGTAITVWAEQKPSEPEA